jgi:transcriptional regulator with GAF, ATPase, and Fis domain
VGWHAALAQILLFPLATAAASGNSASDPTLMAGKRRLVVDLQKALNYQRALAVFTRIVDEPASVPGLLQNAAAQVARITDIKHVKILRYRPDRGDLLVEAGVGWKPGVVGHVSFGADRFSAPGRSLQTGAPVAVEDIANDPEFRYAEVLREHSIVSVLNVPVFVDGTHWGVLEVDTVEKITFTERFTSLRSLPTFSACRSRRTRRGTRPPRPPR